MPKRLISQSIRELDKVMSTRTPPKGKGVTPKKGKGGGPKMGKWGRKNGKTGNWIPVHPF